MKSEKKTSKTTPIRLRDVGLQFKSKKKPNRTITIKTILQGIEITIPTYEGFRIEDRTGVKVQHYSLPLIPCEDGRHLKGGAHRVQC